MKSAAQAKDWNGRVSAAMQLLRIFPAALFLTAVVARHVEPFEYSAQQIVTWYSIRFWTLWVLLICLPLAALVTGCAALLFKPSTAPVDTNLPTRIIAAATVAAGLILVTVILHMLAN